MPGTDVTRVDSEPWIDPALLDTASKTKVSKRSLSAKGNGEKVRTGRSAVLHLQAQALTYSYMLI